MQEQDVNAIDYKDTSFTFSKTKTEDEGGRMENDLFQDNLIHMLSGILDTDDEVNCELIFVKEFLQIRSY